MSRWIIDASLTLGWYLKDEEDRAYSLEVLAGLAENEAKRRPVRTAFQSLDFAWGTSEAG